MKLLYFRIEDYHSLHNLELNFPETPRLPITVLAGVNGTGKSSLLRVLAHIFHMLYNGQGPHLKFILEYTLTRQVGDDKSLNEVRVTGNGSGKPEGVKITVTEKSLTTKKRKARQFVPEQIQWNDFLPKRVIAYTSGNISEWQALLGNEEHNRESRELEALRTLQDGGNIPEEFDPTKEYGGELEQLEREQDASMLDVVTAKGQVTLLTPTFLRLALLATLALKEQNSTRALLHQSIFERIHLKDLEGFAFDLAPTHQSSIAHGLELSPELSEKALALARLAQRRHRNLSNDTFHLYWEMTPTTREALTTIFPDPMQFYEFLSKLHTSGVLIGLDMFLRKTDVPHPILERHLSDGEQEFIGRMAMFLLMDQPEALFLLDEPETHFNDVWKRELIDIVAMIMGPESSSMVMLSTHSIIVLSDLQSEQIVLLQKNEDGIKRLDLAFPTLGANPNEILTQVMDAPSSIGASAEKYLATLLERKWTVDDLPELEKLISEMGFGLARVSLSIIWEQLHATQTKTARRRR